MSVETQVKHIIVEQLGVSVDEVLPAASFESRSVAIPISLTRLPNIRNPISGTEDGTNKATMVNVTIGKRIFAIFRFLIGRLLGTSFPR